MRPPDDDAIYRGTATFAGLKIALWSVAWKVNRTHFMRWYAAMDGMTEDEVHRTSSESPAAAIGQAILYLPENDPIFDKIYGGTR